MKWCQTCPNAALALEDPILFAWPYYCITIFKVKETWLDTWKLIFGYYLLIKIVSNLQFLQQEKSCKILICGDFLFPHVFIT